MGMTTIETFTSLESLLLFQSIATHGTHADAFTNVSASLRASELVRDNAHFDEQRLSEESLKSRYLLLLKDEAKQQLQTAIERRKDGHDTTRNELQPLSPQLPTVADAEEFTHLIPQLIVKLWESYQDHVLSEIREDERRYDELVVEIRIAKQQEEEENAKQGVPAVVTGSSANLTNIPATEILQETQTTSALAQGSGSIAGQDATVPMIEQEPAPKQSTRPEVAEGRLQQKPTTADVKISSILNPTIPESVVHRSPKHAFEIPPPASLPIQHPPLAPAVRRLQPNLAPAITPRTVAQQPMAPIYHQSPYDPIQARPNLAPSPITQYPPQNAYSPVLPIPPGMATAPPPTWSPAQNGPERNPRTPSLPTSSRLLPSPDQKRRPSLPYPDPQRPPTDQWQTPQAYSGRQQQQQQQQHPPPYHQPPPYQTSVPRGGGGGVMLPPFQVSPQNANASNQRALPPPSTISVPPKVHPRPIGTPMQPTTSIQSRVPRGSLGLQTPASSGPQTPMSTILTQLRRRPGVSFSPGSSTGWKIVTSIPLVAEIERPLWSPVSEDETKMDGSAVSTPSTAMRRKRGAKATTTSTIGQDPQPKATPTDNRSVQKVSKAKRGPSATPSFTATTSRGRTRSQSVASHLDDSVLASIPHKRKIKNEPSTPALQPEDSTIEPKSQSSLNGRRKQEKVPAASAFNKRKRIEVEPDAEDVDELTTPRPFDQTLTRMTSTEDELPPQQQNQAPTITAFRNFQKMTVPIMNNITSHKHASLFANPVKERDAEGYTDIIRRPQDLKSIRAAIVAGSRTVAALTTSDGAGTPIGTPRAGGSGGSSSIASAGGGGGGGGSSSAASSSAATTTLPWSIDLVPPRAVVNGAQLEQEVMRMFANAVMFNAGDEGVVRDTREMFESVEASIAAWRAAERNVVAESRAVGISGAGSGAGSGGGRVPTGTPVPVPVTKAEEDMDELGEGGGDEGMVGLPAAKRRRAG